MSPDEVQALAAAVQANCEIADARHAGELSLCNYLLQMREYYRWWHGLGFGQVPPRTDLGRWLAEREAAWEALEGAAFQPLPGAGAAFDAFDTDRVNHLLRPAGLVYGAGGAEAGRPGFFLAELQAQHDGGPVVQHCGRELARGLFAPPAALQGGRTIVLRRDALLRWLWQLWEGFDLHRPDGAFAAWLRGHRVTDAAGFVAALPALADEASTVLRLHEQGEYEAAAWLEPGWAALRLSVQDRRSALLLRAVRDLVADCRVTLPALLDRGEAGPVHFWGASFEGHRATLHPALGAGYRAWAAGEGDAALRAACDAGDRRFAALARELLALGTPEAVTRRLASPG